MEIAQTNGNECIQSIFERGAETTIAEGTSRFLRNSKSALRNLDNGEDTREEAATQVGKTRDKVHLELQQEIYGDEKGSR